MSSEYGWTDKQIGELPLGRLRQITSSIQLRKFQSSREENARFSWLARSISQFVAGGYMTDGKENPAIKQAQSLAMDDIERALLEDAAEAPVARDNRKGSFEALQMFAAQGMSSRG